MSRVVDWILLLVRGRGMQILGLLGYNGTRKTTPYQGNEMAKAIEITDLQLTGEDKKGRPVFTATGTLDERSFTARTITHKGEPIFKLQESEGHQGLEGSAFNRGDRIAVARACKAMRLELFGTGQKERVEGELETGETVELTASGLEVGNIGLEPVHVGVERVLQEELTDEEVEHLFVDVGGEG
jgi:hypothetical protein